MDLYIANPNLQDTDFAFRIPEMSGVKILKILAGGQSKTPGNMNIGQIESIISQHGKYGMIRLDEIDRAKGDYIPLLYQIDKPISESVIRRVLEHNKGVKIKDGKQIRKEAADSVVAAAKGVQGSSLKEVDVEIEEVESKDKNPEVFDIFQGRRQSNNDDAPPTKRGRRGRAA